jgi:hypothetical protein
LLHDCRRREAMGRAAREVALARFTWEACSRRCLEGYEALLDGRLQPNAAV